MRQVNDFFSDVPSSPLYHYTGIGSLLGVVQSKSVWASHAYYMNDSREVIHACDVLQRLLRDSSSSHSSEETELLREAGEWFEHFRIMPFNVFVFSLSERRSLLSQWRGYTPHGKGVSLGFSASTIRFLLRDGFRLGKCLYQPEEHRELVSSLLDKILTTFRQRLPSVDTGAHQPSQRYFGFLEEFRGDVLQVMTLVKDTSFHEECEWRVVSPYYPNFTAPDLRFREGASMLLPYIALPLPPAGTLFDEVILGPSSDANLSMAALSTYLSNQKVCNRTVNPDIPFRKWHAT